MPKVIFKIPNYEEVAYWVFSLIKELKENYRKNIYIDLPEKLVQDIINKDFSEVKEIIIKKIKKEHNIKIDKE